MLNNRISKWPHKIPIKTAIINPIIEQTKSIPNSVESKAVRWSKFTSIWNTSTKRYKLSVIHKIVRRENKTSRIAEQYLHKIVKITWIKNVETYK